MNDVNFSIVPTSAHIGIHTIEIRADVLEIEAQFDESVSFTIEVRDKCDWLIQMQGPVMQPITY